ncbi:MAG TPA: thiamine phosphate synthase [Dehalococcoidia bacterium]|nr:thiamine phosphate synthase [Dehalococcoidia bacterium]
MNEKLRGLYLLADPAATAGRDLAEVVAAGLRGGVRLIQLRDKDSPKGAQFRLARRLLELCRQSGALFLINDHVDLALAVGADGVHLGQQDLPVAVVRRLVPRDFVVGCSTNNVKEALDAQAAGASYVSVGRLFPTGSKRDTRPATLETLRQVKEAVSLPVCAIGGIDESNIEAVLAAGADMAAVIAAVMSAEDPEAAARRLSQRFKQTAAG